MPFSAVRGKEINMRKVKIASLVLAFVLVFGCTTASALTRTISVQMYKPANNLILEPEVSGQIVTVEKYTFKYTGKETFASAEKLLDNVDARQINPTSMKWVSSNEEVASVNSKGTVTGIKKGSVYIYPVPKGVYSYKTKGKYIIYLNGNLSGGFRIYGGIGAKVKVTA